MNSFYSKESICIEEFSQLGECWHVWTPENFEIIFVSEEDFKMGMTIIALCALSHPKIKIITFIIMSNHLHIVICGTEIAVTDFFNMLQKHLGRHFKSRGRAIAWNNFIPGIRRLDSLEDIRNVIVYDNRNGYIVNNAYTPYTYPWGANKYYFNDDAKSYALERSIRMSLRDKRRLGHSRAFDGITQLVTVNGYASPLSFCDIAAGERMFRDAAHYFSKLSKSIESDRLIAKEIGESIYYTDDELYAAMAKIARDKYQSPSPSTASPSAKAELAKTMHFDYNASSKQICRILKIPQELLNAMGIH